MAVVTFASEGDRGIPHEVARFLQKSNAETLRRILKAVQDQLAETETRERETALAEMEALAAKRGLSPEEVRGHFARKRGETKRSVQNPVRYRHPKTGETWTGVGRKANWVKDFEANGGNLADVAVREGD